TLELLGLHDRSTLCCGGGVPLPLNAATAGELAALLANETLSDAVPLACGVNTTLTVALCPAVTVRGNETPLRVNSEVLNPAEETVTLAPVALNVALLVLLCPTMTLPKLRVAGETVN